MKKLDYVVMAFLIFAGLNWGLWGLFEFNLVNYIIGQDWVSRVFYVILGFCGMYYVVGIKSIAERMSSKRK